MTPTIFWPETLPCPQYEGRACQVVDPTIRTDFASGRSRVRRAFTSVPVAQTVEWKMTRAQAVEFERFFREDLKDGSEWFSMEMVLPQGKGPWAFRFVSIYEGPVLVGAPDTGVWVYRAELEQWLRAK